MNRLFYGKLYYKVLALFYTLSKFDPLAPFPLQIQKPNAKLYMIYAVPLILYQGIRSRVHPKEY